MNNVPMIIRYVLTLLLIYGAYTETGIWTALNFFLIFIAVEVMGRRINKRR